MSEPETFNSVRAFARAIGRSHSSVGEWLHHPEWPLQSVPPWKPAHVLAAREWADETLRDSTLIKVKPVEVPAPGFAIGPDELCGSPFNTPIHLGELWDCLSHRDLVSLANALTAAVAFEMIDVSTERGEGQKDAILSRAPVAYYHRLLRLCEKHNPERLTGRMNNALIYFLAQRFNVERPNWFGEMPDPPFDELPDELRNVEPLDHRKPATTQPAKLKPSQKKSQTAGTSGKVNECPTRT